MLSRHIVIAQPLSLMFYTLRILKFLAIWHILMNADTKLFAIRYTLTFMFEKKFEDQGIGMNFRLNVKKS